MRMRSRAGGASELRSTELLEPVLAEGVMATASYLEAHQLVVYVRRALLDGQAGGQVSDDFGMVSP